MFYVNCLTMQLTQVQSNNGPQDLTKTAMKQEKQQWNKKYGILKIHCDPLEMNSLSFC